MMESQDNMELLDDIATPSGFYDSFDLNLSNSLQDATRPSIGSRTNNTKTADGLACNTTRDTNCRDDTFRLRKLVSINSQSSSSESCSTGANTNSSSSTTNNTCRTINLDGTATFNAARRQRYGGNGTLPTSASNAGGSSQVVEDDFVALEDIEMPSFATDTTMNSSGVMLVSLSPGVGLDSPAADMTCVYPYDGRGGGLETLVTGLGARRKCDVGSGQTNALDTTTIGKSSTVAANAIHNDDSLSACDSASTTERVGAATDQDGEASCDVLNMSQMNTTLDISTLESDSNNRNKTVDILTTADPTIDLFRNINLTQVTGDSVANKGPARNRDQFLGATMNDLDVSKPQTLQSQATASSLTATGARHVRHQNIMQSDQALLDSPIFDPRCSKDVENILRSLERTGLEVEDDVITPSKDNNEEDSQSSLLNFDQMNLDWNQLGNTGSVASQAGVLPTSEFLLTPGEQTLDSCTAFLKMAATEAHHSRKSDIDNEIDIAAITAALKGNNQVLNFAGLLKGKHRTKESTSHCVLVEEGAANGVEKAAGGCTNIQRGMVGSDVFSSSGVKNSVKFGPTSVITFEDPDHSKYNKLLSNSIMSKKINSTFDGNGSLLQSAAFSTDTGTETKQSNVRAAVAATVKTTVEASMASNAKKSTVAAANIILGDNLQNTVNRKNANTTFDGDCIPKSTNAGQTNACAMLGSKKGTSKANSTTDDNGPFVASKKGAANTTFEAPHPITKQAHNSANTKANETFQRPKTSTVDTTFELPAGGANTTFDAVAGSRIGNQTFDQPGGEAAAQRAPTSRMNSTFDQRPAGRGGVNTTFDQGSSDGHGNATFDQQPYGLGNVTFDQDDKCNSTFDQASGKQRFAPSPISNIDRYRRSSAIGDPAFGLRETNAYGDNDDGVRGRLLQQRSPVGRYLNRSLSMPCQQSPPNEEELNQSVQILCQSQSYSCINLMDADAPVLKHILRMEPGKQAELRMLFESPAKQRSAKQRRSLPNNFTTPTNSSTKRVSLAPSQDSLTGGGDGEQDLGHHHNITTSTPKPAKTVQEILSLYKPRLHQLQDDDCEEGASEEAETKYQPKTIAQILNRYQPLTSLPSHAEQEDGPQQQVEAENGGKRGSGPVTTTAAACVVPASITNGHHDVVAKLRRNRQQQVTAMAAAASGVATAGPGAGPLKAFHPKRAGLQQQLPLRPAASTPDNGDEAAGASARVGSPREQTTVDGAAAISATKPSDRPSLPSFGSFSSIDSGRPGSPELGLDNNKFACTLDSPLPNGSVSNGCRTSTPATRAGGGVFPHPLAAPSTAPHATAPTPIAHLLQQHHRYSSATPNTPASGGGSNSGGASGLKIAMLKQQKLRLQQQQQQQFATPPLQQIKEHLDSGVEKAKASVATSRRPTASTPDSELLQRPLRYDTPPTVTDLPLPDDTAEPETGDGEGAKITRRIQKYEIPTSFKNKPQSRDLSPLPCEDVVNLKVASTTVCLAADAPPSSLTATFQRQDACDASCEEVSFIPTVEGNRTQQLDHRPDSTFQLCLVDSKETDAGTCAKKALNTTVVLPKDRNVDQNETCVHGEGATKLAQGLPSDCTGEITTTLFVESEQFLSRGSTSIGRCSQSSDENNSIISVSQKTLLNESFMMSVDKLSSSPSDGNVTVNNRKSELGRSISHIPSPVLAVKYQVDHRNVPACVTTTSFKTPCNATLHLTPSRIPSPVRARASLTENITSECLHSSTAEHVACSVTLVTPRVTPLRCGSVSLSSIPEDEVDSSQGHDSGSIPKASGVTSVSSVTSDSVFSCASSNTSIKSNSSGRGIPVRKNSVPTSICAPAATTKKTVPSGISRGLKLPSVIISTEVDMNKSSSTAADVRSTTGVGKIRTIPSVVSSQSDAVSKLQAPSKRPTALTKPCLVVPRTRSSTARSLKPPGVASALNSLRPSSDTGKLNASRSRISVDSGSAALKVANPGLKSITDKKSTMSGSTAVVRRVSSVVAIATRKTLPAPAAKTAVVASVGRAAVSVTAGRAANAATAGRATFADPALRTTPLPSPKKTLATLKPHPTSSSGGAVKKTKLMPAKQSLLLAGNMKIPQGMNALTRRSVLPTIGARSDTERALVGKSLRVSERTQPKGSTEIKSGNLPKFSEESSDAKPDSEIHYSNSYGSNNDKENKPPKLEESNKNSNAYEPFERLKDIPSLSKLTRCNGSNDVLASAETNSSGTTRSKIQVLGSYPTSSQLSPDTTITVDKTITSNVLPEQKSSLVRPLRPVSSSQLPQRPSLLKAPSQGVSRLRRPGSGLPLPSKLRLPG